MEILFLSGVLLCCTKDDSRGFRKNLGSVPDQIEKSQISISLCKRWFSVTRFDYNGA